MDSFRILLRGISVPEALVASNHVVNVSIGGHRVWSFRIDDPDSGGGLVDGVIEWPAALRERLNGIGVFVLSNAVTGEQLYVATAQFGELPTPIYVKDAVGRDLSISKWGRLVPSFEGSHEGVFEVLLERTQGVIADLERLGYPAFIVGGTLLGAVRSGDFLPNDDDADLAYLSEYSHPIDLANESFRMEHELTGLGYFVVRHSAAHLQITFLAGEGLTDFYVDIFTAFFKDGEFCEPIHVRTDSIAREDIVPFSTVTLAGAPLPAPANSEAWLEACYGPGWLVPDPSFTFVTPRSTLRRFHGWFGTENRDRFEWNQHYADEIAEDAVSAMPSPEGRRFAQLLPAESLVVDVGCGTGADANYFASLGHTVIAFDYSWNAIDFAKHSSHADDGGVDFALLNLYNRRDLLTLSIELTALDRDVNFYARHVFAGVTNSAKFNAMMLARQHLRRGGLAYVAAYAELAQNYSPDDAETWHLPYELQRKAAIENGLVIDQIGSTQLRTRVGERLVIETVLRKHKAES